MAGTVRELLTKWGFQVDQKPLERFNKSISDAKTTIALVGAQAIAQAGALFGLADSVATTGDEFAKTANRIGFSIETLQEYSHVAQLAGSSTQEMNGAIEGLTLSISEAKKGGGSLIEPLIRLNQITGRDLLSSMGNADDLMLELADTFATMTDETEKAELATKIFGGSGLAMVNVLNQGSAAIKAQKQEARDLGVVLSEKVAKQSEVFKDSLLRVKQVFLGLRNSVGAELIPLITEIMDQFRDWVKINKEWIKGGIKTVIDSMISGTKTLLSVTSKMFKVIKSLVKAFGGLENVLQFVIIAMATFTAVKFLSAIGNMAIAVGSGLVLAFRSVGNAALIAQVKMFAIPIAIGLAIAAIALLIEDVVAFFQGRDSITGKIIKALEGVDIAGVLRSKFNAATSVVRDFANKVSSWLDNLFDMPDLELDIAGAVKNALQGISEFFDGLTFEGLVSKLSDLLLGLFTGEGVAGAIFNFFFVAFQSIGDAIIRVVIGAAGVIADTIKGIFTGIMDFSGEDGTITKGVSAVKGFFGFGDDEEEDGKKKKRRIPRPSSDLQGNINSLGIGDLRSRPDLKLINGGGGSSVRNSNSNVTNNNEVSISVVVPEGTNQKDASAIVDKGVSDALNRMARETQAATATSVER